MATNGIYNWTTNTKHQNGGEFSFVELSEGDHDQVTPQGVTWNNASNLFVL